MAPESVAPETMSSDSNDLAQAAKSGGEMVASQGTDHGKRLRTPIW